MTHLCGGLEIISGKSRRYSPKFFSNESNKHTDHGLDDIQASEGNDKADSNFRQLHDLARHVIHICEVLEVAAESAQELSEEHGTAPGSPCNCPGVSTKAKTNCPHNEMRFSLRTLRNFGRRAASLKSRLDNEINLVRAPWDHV